MDVMKRLGILIGGAVFMIPTIPAASTYLTRLGPKPLSFSAPRPPREEVLIRLPPLKTGFEPAEPDTPTGPSGMPSNDVSNLWPMPYDPGSMVLPEEFPRLPADWIERLFGPPRPPEGDVGPAPLLQTERPLRPYLTPEDLVPFFTSPGSGGNPTIVVPVPFIPGIPGAPAVPATSGSSSATFRQE